MVFIWLPGPYMALYGLGGLLIAPLEPLMEPYGALWSPLRAPYGAFLGLIEPYGALWSLMEPYRTL